MPETSSSNSEHSQDSGIVSVPDWEKVGRSLSTFGWVCLSRAIPVKELRPLIEARPSPWHALLKEEGVVRQGGFGAHADLAVTAPSVRTLAQDLVSSLDAVVNTAPIPAFNEVSWTLYPEGSGHITAHRDPAVFTGVIAVATLSGSAKFRVSNGSDHAEWDTEPGDIVILGTQAWPGEFSGPVHEVDPPENGDRLIMTLRHNSRGAGGGYDVGPTEFRDVWPKTT